MLEKLSEYVKGKVRKCHPNHPNANTGAKQMIGFEDMIDDFCDYAINTIGELFEAKFRSSPRGSIPLTHASMKLGEYILKKVDNPKEGKARMFDQVRTGDLMLEAFVVMGYIELEKLSETAGYTIHITDAWLVDREAPGLRSTEYEPITDGVLIKGEDNKRSQNTVWCRSAMKLMQVPWRINTPVYEALRASNGIFDKDMAGVTDKDRLDSEKSKRNERRSIEDKAEQLLGKVFYQRVEADYRGRLYYGEPYLNFQGSDHARGLFLFAEEKELDAAGQWWLAVHTASSYNQSYDIEEIPEWAEADYRSHLEAEGLDSISVDKFTLEDRVRWTNENMETIILAGAIKEFFPEAEKPVSFLACCIEWEKISRGDLMSSLPIPIDGSNNGWQHLGAISKDTRTGKLVGLVAQEIQQDFYVKTAKQLLEIDDPILNAMPMKHVRKGVSKRGSMTRAYSAGAGKIGENMWFDIRSEGYHDKYDIDEKDCKRWANELIKAINVVCPGPLSTMEYLQNLASFEIGTYKKYRDGQPAGEAYFKLRKELSEQYSLKHEKRDTDRIEEIMEEISEFETVLVQGNGERRIRWTTPSGFPVTYESYRKDTFKCKGRIAGQYINHVLQIEAENKEGKPIPDIRGYMCGISPNYIHSMDAAHMALVIDQWDGAFGAVHDSFSTHACDVDHLLNITKETFIEMYDVDDYLVKIREDILTNTEGFEYPKPELGSLEIQEIRNSDYFFA